MKLSVSYLFLASGVASASLERKRFTVNTDAQRSSDAFGFTTPFGFERALGGMSMSMSMSLSMSMSMSMPISGSGSGFMPIASTGSNLVSQITGQTGVSVVTDSESSTEVDSGYVSVPVAGSIAVVDPVENEGGDSSTTSTSSTTDNTSTADNTSTTPTTSETPTAPDTVDTTPDTNTVSTPESNEPVSNEPVSNEPVSNEPVSNEPVSNEPVSNEPAPSEPVSSEPSVPNTPSKQQATTAMTSDEKSRTCPNFSSSQMQTFDIQFAYHMETDTATDIPSTKSAVDAAILDAITSAGLMSCDVISRKLEEFITMKRTIHSEARHLNSQFMLRNMEIDSNISSDYTCTPSQDGACNVVLNTLSVSTDHPTVTKSDVRKQTISTVQNSMASMSMAGATLTYKPMNSLTSSTQEAESDVFSEDEDEDAAPEDSPQLSVSAKSTDQVNNDEDTTKVEKKSISSAATGAMAAGALAAVFAGLFLIKKKRSMSTTEIDYVDEDILGARDIEQDGTTGFGDLAAADETALVDVDLSQDNVVII